MTSHLPSHVSRGGLPHLVGGGPPHHPPVPPPLPPGLPWRIVSSVPGVPPQQPTSVDDAVRIFREQLLLLQQQAAASGSAAPVMATVTVTHEPAQVEGAGPSPFQYTGPGVPRV